MSDGDIQSRYVKLNKDQAPVDINPGELNQPIEVPQVIIPSKFIRFPHPSCEILYHCDSCAPTVDCVHTLLNVRKCNECGQPLPESFEPPAVEPWSTGIFGCAEDMESCRTGLFCPCVLFGRNYENLRDDDTPWTTPCVCHAIFVEGGMALAAATAVFHGVDPRASFLICEGLLFSWWMCGIYTGIVRQMLQRKYHLKNSPCDPCLVHCCMHWCALCQEHREMKGRLSDNMVMPMTLVNAPPVQQMNTDTDNQDSSSAAANGHQHHTNLEMQAL